jgi:hypothetical protein
MPGTLRRRFSTASPKRTAEFLQPALLAIDVVAQPVADHWMYHPGPRRIDTPLSTVAHKAIGRSLH